MLKINDLLCKEKPPGVARGLFSFCYQFNKVGKFVCHLG
jgi:hypothetical protein